MSDLTNDIINYHKGKLTPEEMHVLERKALDDPFLAEALEGSSQISSEAFGEDLMALSSRLNKQIHKRPVGQAPPSLWTWPLRIAAGLVILISATVVFFALRFEKTSDTLALNEEVHSPIPEHAAPPADSTYGRVSGESTPSETIQKEDKKGLSKPAPAIQIQPAKESKDTKDVAAASEAPASSTFSADMEVAADKLADRAGEPLSQVTPETEANPPLLAPSPGLSKSKLEEVQVEEKRNYAAKKGAASADEREKVSTGAVQRKSAKSSNAISQTIKGQVFDVTGTGLPGVNILIKGTGVGTVTDATGNYEIATEKKDPTLVYSSIGYSSHEIDVAGKKEINISLDEDVSQLSEVVVTGYGIEKDDSDMTIPLELASPEGGRRAYKQYLEKNLQYPERALGKNVEGKVTIQFAVEPSGELADFRVIKGIGDGCDEEVIRLIKSGPKWAPTKRDTEKLRGMVRVKMRFQVPKRK
ncbi:MAG: TonB family protein [Chryseolinea sp.]